MAAILHGELPLACNVFIVKTSSGPFIAYPPCTVGVMRSMVSNAFPVVIFELCDRDKLRRDRLKSRLYNRQFRCRLTTFMLPRDSEQNSEIRLTEQLPQMDLHLLMTASSHGINYITCVGSVPKNSSPSSKMRWCPHRLEWELEPIDPRRGPQRRANERLRSTYHTAVDQAPTLPADASVAVRMRRLRCFIGNRSRMTAATSI